MASIQKSIRSLTRGFADINGFIATVQRGFQVAAQAAEIFADEIKRLDDLADVAQRLNITADSLQKFQRAAELSGASVDSIARSMGKLQMNLGDAALGQNSGVTKALDRLNLSAAELTNIGIDDAFQRVVIELAKMPNAMERSATAADLFGKSAMELNALMAEGSNVFAEAARDVDLFGVKIGDRAKDIDAAAKAMERLKMSSSAFKTEATLTLAPPASAIMEGNAMMMSIARRMDRMNTAMGLLGMALRVPLAEQVLANEIGAATVRTLTPSPAVPSAPPVRDTEADFMRRFGGERVQQRGIHGAAAPPAMARAVLPLLDESMFRAPDLRSAAGGAGALEFGSVGAFQAIQASKREDESRRINMQQLDQLKKIAEETKKTREELEKAGEEALEVANLQG